ncbi:hypothetical protein MRX96_037837 [Rhipicephalus microplus]
MASRRKHHGTPHCRNSPKQRRGDVLTDRALKTPASVVVNKAGEQHPAAAASKVHGGQRLEGPYRSASVSGPGNQAKQETLLSERSDRGQVQQNPSAARAMCGVVGPGEASVARNEMPSPALTAPQPTDLQLRRAGMYNGSRRSLPALSFFVVELFAIY